MTYGRDQACHLRLLSAQTEKQRSDEGGNHDRPPSPVLARLRRETEPHDLGKLVVRLASLAAQAHTMMMANETAQYDDTPIGPLPFTDPDDPSQNGDGGGHAA